MEIMMMNELILTVIGMMVVTYLPRLLPMLLMKNVTIPRKLDIFLSYVPYAILGALIFPSVFSATGNPVTAVVGMVVALITAWFIKNPTSVVVISIIVVYILELNI
jgi:branched-subunit amino acid transport protein